MIDRDKTISPSGSPPGSPPGSPLRRRMSEDMTVRGFTPCTRARIHPRAQRFHGFSWPLCGLRGRGGPAALSVGDGLQRGLGNRHDAAARKIDSYGCCVPNPLASMTGSYRHTP